MNLTMIRVKAATFHRLEEFAHNGTISAQGLVYDEPTDTYLMEIYQETMAVIESFRAPTATVDDALLKMIDYAGRNMTTYERLTSGLVLLPEETRKAKQ